MEASDTIAQLEAMIQAGQIEDATKLLNSFSPTPLPAPDTHLTLAHIAEHTGQLNRAISEYNLALRHQPEHVDVLLRIAQLHIDKGDWQHTIETHRKLLSIQPDNPVFVLSLGHALEQSGQWPEARHLYQQHKQLDETAMTQALRRLEREWQAETQEESSPATSGLFAEPDFAPGEMEAVAMAHLFAGREGVYAKQWVGQSGKHGYSPVQEPFTPHVAQKHLNGELTAGIYPVRMDNSVLFMAFDFDITREALSAKHLAGRSQVLSRLMAWVQSVSQRLVDLGRSYQLHGLIEESGWKGRHVWFFFQEPTPAIAARRIGQWLLDRLGPLPEHISVEFFPKQSRLEHDKLGNLIKLPLGIHRVTGKRCLFLDEKGRPFKDAFAPLHHPQKASRQAVQALLQEVSAVSSRPSPRGETRSGRDANQAQDLSGFGYERMSHVPDPTVHPDDSPELQWLLGHCPVLRELVTAIEAGKLLSPDAQHVLLYTVGHLPSGPSLLRHLLGSILNALPAAFPTTRLKGYPMSCPKIRRRVPEVAGSVDCHCVFGETGSYPNPLLHLDTLQQTPTQAPSAQLQALQIERAISDLMRARQDYQRLHLLMFTLEERIRHWMKELSSSVLHTTAGTAELGAQQQICLRVDAPSGSPVQALLALAQKQPTEPDETDDHAGKEVVAP